MQSFIQDLFSFEKARYTTVDALASDIVNISKHRIDQVLQKFGVELTWCGDKRLDSNKLYIVLCVKFWDRFVQGELYVVLKRAG